MGSIARHGRAVLSALVVATLVGNAWAQAPAEPQPTVIVRVGEAEITGVEIAIAAEAMLGQLSQLSEEQRSEFLVQTVLDMNLMAIGARELGLDDAELFKRRLAFEEARLLQQAFANRIAADATTDQALAAAYDEYVVAFKPFEERRFSHILTDTKGKANEALSRVAGGEDFAAVGKTLSIDPAAEQGVNLGFLADGDLVDPLNAAAFALEEGGVTEPIATQFGWHILKFEELRKSEPASFDQQRDSLANRLAEAAIRQALAELSDRLSVEMLQPLASEDATSAP